MPEAPSASVADEPAARGEVPAAPIVPPPLPPPAPRRFEPELDHGVAPGLDKRSLNRLRRGQIRPEGRIDLHGHTQDHAHTALTGFLAASQRGGRRCVLVITGKGVRGDGTTGVLRDSVPRWLNQPPDRPRVLAFCHAVPADGGAGALYVLLRRLR